MSNARRWAFDLTLWTISLITGLALIAHEAMAGEKRMTAGNARYEAECASCHLAYPPQLLPAPAWRRIMAGLGKHFGTNATLDASAAAEIGNFLDGAAGTGKRVAGAGDNSLRITRTPWFEREHGEVPSAAWRRPSVGGPGNCAACHTAAPQGDFDEHNVRIPR